MSRKVIVASIMGLLLIVLAGAWILRFERRSRAPAALAARTARGSARMKQLIGEPMHVSRLAKGRVFTNRGNGSADLTIQIRGPLGRGELNEWAQEDTGKWKICSLQFRSNDGSMSIALVDGSLTHCEPE
ncbi:MAG: cytochrome c oxidase assembly factor Coa1 family protein [Terracidiphilus sp.]|jgi:hypothetical protein